MMKSKFILVLGLMLMVLPLCAQSQSDMRINEILLINKSDFQDDFGVQSPWIELFNTSYGTVDIGGCFLSNDPNNLKKYIIPKGDVMTKIKPRQHTLFWADNSPFRGTFHTNFLIEASQEIIFTASDGRTIIDRIVIPNGLLPDQSYGRKDDGIGSYDGTTEGWELRQWTSPSTNNSGVDAKTKSMIMQQEDPYGWVLAITSMSVVFLALIILTVLFNLTGAISIKSQQKKSDKSTEEANSANISVSDTSSEAFAAIATAMHLYFEENESHDDESFTITLGHTDRSYSPWSSKFYGLRQTPALKKNK